MMLAPTPTLRGQVVPLASGARGVDQTIRAMRQLVNAGKVDLTMRQAATSAVWLTPERDALAEISALHSWVRDNVRFVQDIHDIETISTPEKTLAGRIGDCDDQAVLLATLLECVGYATRFVVTGYTVPGSLEHVYLQVFAGGEWIDCDPTEHEPLGWAPPDPVTVMLENIA